MNRTLLWLCLAIALTGSNAQAASGIFLRGDCNANGSLELGDVVTNLNYQFVSGQVTCLDACDLNDDGLIGLDDVFYGLNFLFQSGPAPLSPTLACGPDTTEDDLNCLEFAVCSTTGLSLSAGDVTQDSVYIWVRSNFVGDVLVEVSTDAGFASTVDSFNLTIVDELQPNKMLVDGLTAGTQYFYRATANGLPVIGEFRTPAALGSNTGLRFGVSGDWRGELAPYPSIANTVERNLDFFLLHGDTVYADFPSPALQEPQAETLTEFRLKQREVYADSFGSNPWRALRSATAIFATIDDHEVTNDFAGGAATGTDPRFTFTTESFINETPLFNNGLQAFQENNPIADEFYGATGDPRTENRRKLYRNRTFGSDASIHVLDTRSFRDQQLPPVVNISDLTEVSQFLIAAFDPTRTLLGQAQLTDLTTDLAAAQAAGVTWKFVFVPEPIQNLGVLAGQDRFEGYAAERTFLLDFIETNGINNVVFVAADIHGQLINNLTYQLGPGQAQMTTGAFEISTGSVAFDAPFGPTVVALAAAAGLVTPPEVAFYESLPRPGQDAFIETLTNQQLALLAYDPIGLTGSPVNHTVEVGSFVNLHTYGWSEFEIDATTQELTVTTYGIDFYSEAELVADPTILERVPEVVSRFTVIPQ